MKKQRATRSDRSVEHEMRRETWARRPGLCEEVRNTRHLLARPTHGRWRSDGGSAELVRRALSTVDRRAVKDSCGAR
jgi:hypothetical protein